MGKVDKKTRVIVTRVTEKEFAELLRRSVEMNMSFSELLRVGALMLARKELKP